MKRKNIKKDGSKGYQLVYQHNRLVEAKYDFTLQEKKLILFSLFKLQSTKDGLKPVQFSCEELSQMCGLKTDSFYKDLKKTVQKIMKRVLTIRDLDNQILRHVNWLSEAKYEEKKGTVTLHFNQRIASFLMDLKSNFTAIPISQTLGLSSIYAIRMFELLKQYEKVGERNFEIKELRDILGISTEKFDDFYDFKRKVLQISQRELALKTDIRFEFEEIKTSRKVTSLLFFIYKNDPNKIKIEHEEKEKIKRVKAEIISEYEKKELLEFGFSLPTIRKFFNEFSDQKIRNALQVTLNQIEKGHVKNAKALFQKALKEGWSLG